MRIQTNPQIQPRSLNNQLWRGKNFLTFGTANAYPQNCRRILEASPTGIACRNRFSDFLEGDGFENENFMQSRINFRGTQVWQLLNQVCLDYATHAYFAVHVNYNLNLEPVSYTRINPEFVRLGLPDSRGYCPKVAISKDWTADNAVLVDRAVIEHVDVWNPEPQVVARQIEKAGGINMYKGQVYVFWGNEQQYPIAPHHTVLKAMETEQGIIEYKYSQVNDGFVANHAFVFTEPFQDEAEAKHIKARIQAMIGPAGDKVAVLDGVGENGLQIMELKQTANDAQFDQTDESIRNKIIRAYTQPGILHNEYRAGALGGTSEIENAFILYNQTTKKHRNIIERCFEELFTWYFRDLNPGGNYDIKELSFQGNENRNTDTQGNGLPESQAAA